MKNFHMNFLFSSKEVILSMSSVRNYLFQNLVLPTGILFIPALTKEKFSMENAERRFLPPPPQKKKNSRHLIAFPLASSFQL